MNPAGLEGIWVPVRPGMSSEQLEGVVDDWLRGWDGSESDDGPALLAELAGTPGPVGT